MIFPSLPLLKEFRNSPKSKNNKMKHLLKFHNKFNKKFIAVLQDFIELLLKIK
jgi:hypothetical protein